MRRPEDFSNMTAEQSANRYTYEQLRDMTEDEKRAEAERVTRLSGNTWSYCTALGETMLDVKYPQGDPRRWERHLPKWKRVVHAVARFFGLTV